MASSKLDLNNPPKFLSILGSKEVKFDEINESVTMTFDIGDELNSTSISPELCVIYAGFNLHANTVIDADDRDRDGHAADAAQHRRRADERVVARRRRDDELRRGRLDLAALEQLRGERT